MTAEKGWKLYLLLCAVDDVLEAVVACALVLCVLSCIGCMVAIYRERRRNGKTAKH